MTIYKNRQEVNEAYAREVEGLKVVCGASVEIDIFDSEQFVTKRLLPDYVQELGARHVLTAISLKLHGETESAMCHNLE